MEAAFAEASRAIDASASRLKPLGEKIHENPELAYKETLAHDLLSNYLIDAGFKVEKHYILPTGFKATAGNGSPVIAVLCEYDALPGIGHACGHNLIAVAGVAAAIGIKSALAHSEGQSGTVVVLGTPAEEGPGGKIDMIDGGALEGVDAAMMVHPSFVETVAPPSLAMQELQVTFHGKNAHASTAPWEGVNALDAMIAAFNSIALMRQQIKPTDRVHGVIVEGGTKANIIPDRTKCEFYVRSSTRENLAFLKEKVLRCFQGAALSTGCTMEHRWAAIGLGVEMLSLEEQAKIPPMGSTDMGNVSHLVPSIHPRYKIPTESVNHTPGFAEAAKKPESYERTWTAAKAMATTGMKEDTCYSIFHSTLFVDCTHHFPTFSSLSLIFDPALLKAAKDEFDRSRRAPAY